MGRNCVICGKPSGAYWFCKSCNRLKNEGKIVKCETCKKWHLIGEPCDCIVEEDINEESTVVKCLGCGNDAYPGQHFCYDCWKKYHKKICYVKIKGCKESNVIQSEYESPVVCDDGHMVKSPLEKIFDNWLYQERIPHAYEIKIDVTEELDLAPDFYIPSYEGANGLIKNIYVEIWGYDESNIAYAKRKKFKKEIYPSIVEREHYTFLYITKEEILNDSFKKKLKRIKPEQINE